MVLILRAILKMPSKSKSAGDFLFSKTKDDKKKKNGKPEQVVNKETEALI